MILCSYLPVHSYPAVINRLREHSSDIAINVADFEANQSSAERVPIARIRPFACQNDVLTVGVFGVAGVQSNSSNLAVKRKKTVLRRAYANRATFAFPRVSTI